MQIQAFEGIYLLKPIVIYGILAPMIQEQLERKIGTDTLSLLLTLGFSFDEIEVFAENDRVITELRALYGLPS